MGWWPFRRKSVVVAAVASTEATVPVAATAAESPPPPGTRANHALSIAIPEESLALDGDRTGTLRFLVGSTTDRVLALRASVVAREPFDAAWCTVRPVAFDLEAGAKREVTVAIAVPRSAATGVRICHLVVWSVADPDEDFLTSVDVAITVPVPRSRIRLRLPWWLYALLGILLAGAGNAWLASESAASAQRVATPTRVGVPDLSGLASDQLLPALGPDLRPGVLRRRVTGAAPLGAVLDQQPSAGRVVTPGARLDVVVEAGVRLPAVTGQSVTAAQAALRAIGLTVTVVAQRDDQSSASFGTVLSQQPIAGSLVAVPSTVHVNVLSGIAVPDLLGQDPWQAQRTLTGLGLLPRTQLVASAPSAPDRQGQVVVVTQTPAPGTQLAAGAAVQLQLAWRESP